MTHDSFTSAWKEGRAAVGGWITSDSLYLIELYDRAGYDYVGIDCQHTTVSESAAALMLQRSAGIRPAIVVRVSKNDSSLIGRLADAGADAVIVPMVSSAEEAQNAVSAVRYPPNGVRSFGPMRSDLGVELKSLEAHVSLLVMIETAEGLAQVKEIASTPGIAGIYVGPADLSIGLGFDPMTAFTTDNLVEPLARIRAACEEANVIFAMHTLGGEDAARRISMGVTMVSLGADAGLFYKAAIADRQAALAKATPTPSDTSSGLYT
jgi:4-hydroxy-2-oxoheptanedioate aldolase